MTLINENPPQSNTGSGLYGCAGVARTKYIAAGQYMQRRMRFAPYSRGVIRLLQLGQVPNVYIFSGSDAWKQAERRRQTHGEGSTLILPPGDNPHGFKWPAINALIAIPGDCDGERFRHLIVALLMAGSRCVVEARIDQAPTCHYASADDAREAA